MTIKKLTLAIFMLCALALLSGTSFAAGPGLETGSEYSMQLSVNLVTGGDPEGWKNVDLDTSLSDLGITSSTFDDLLDELLILLDPRGDSYWHGRMLSSSWDANGDWNFPITFDDGLTTVVEDGWLDGGQMWLGIEVPGWYPDLATMTWTEASGLTINDIISM